MSTPSPSPAAPAGASGASGIKTMIASDLIPLRVFALQMLGIAAFLAVVISFFAESVFAAIAAIASMLPMIVLMTLFAQDEQDGWERFRLALPLTRAQVVLGRYAVFALSAVASIALSIALGFAITAAASALPAGVAPQALMWDQNPARLLALIPVLVVELMMLVAAVAMPLLFRFGMTTGTRYLPVLIVFAVLAAVTLIQQFGQETMFAAALGHLESGSPEGLAILAVTMALTLIALAASAFVATRLYAQRQL